MSTRFLEDFVIGETWESAPTPLTADEIVDFGRRYDPQPMHTDAERAAAGPFKGLVASGWHIAALSMRLFIQAGGHGATPAVGLGIDELRWLAPARAGDTLTVRREVIDVRRSASNPSHGIVRTRVTVRNQDGTAVMTLISAGRVPARPVAGDATKEGP
ncbi:MAG: MaoC family dehydratase [Rhizobacter sp.]|nr:MaoC family dehydratase [Rhizobacter sp.]